MKTKILSLLILLVVLISSCAGPRNATLTWSCCDYQEYSGLKSCGIPGVVDIMTITRTVNNKTVKYDTEYKKVYNLYCQNRLDTLSVKSIPNVSQ